MSLRASEFQRSTEPTTTGLKVRTKGDESATITWPQVTAIYVWREPLTADRTATLSVVGPPSTGARLKIVRAASATGAFGLSVGGLRTLAPGEWAEVEYTGSAWALVTDVPGAAYRLTATPTATGTLLEWGNPDARAEEIEVHRSTTEDFTPGAGTLVDTLAGAASDYTDTV